MSGIRPFFLSGVVEGVVLDCKCEDAFARVGEGVTEVEDKGKFVDSGVVGNCRCCCRCSALVGDVSFGAGNEGMSDNGCSLCSDEN